MTAYGTARGWAWGIVAAVGLSQAVWLWLLVAHRDQLPGAVARSWPIHAESAVLVTFIAALGALIIGTYPRHRVGWIMVGVAGTVVIDATARVYALAGLYLRPGALPGPEYGAWVAEWLWFPSMVALLVFLPLYFPDGRLPSPRWRPVVMGMALWLALASIGYALAPQSEPIDFPDVEKAIQYQPAIVLSALMLGTPVALGLSFTAVLLRRRRAVGVEREQLRWFLYAVALVVAGWTISIAVGTLAGTTWGPVGAALTHGPLFALVAAITFAIRWHRLYDIDFLINRTLIYGGLTAAVLVAYGAIVLAASQVSTAELEWRGSVLVVAVVAIAAYPVRDWLQRAVNRLMYGDRDDPARAMSRLSRRVADSLSPASLLPAIAETVGRALRLPYVAVELPGRRAVAYGVPGDALEGFPLVHQGEHVGTLMVGRRSASESFSAADRSVIADLARQVAAAAHAVNLSDELQRSRERLVQAREEERLRLRRDLHDGVGSALAGLALRAGTARHAPGEGGEARRVLGDLEDGIRAAVLDIRRIVDDLRPPAVDELGLAGALAERSGSLLPGIAVVSRLDAGRLPAAVEVAAYRIATEALANVARHACASRVELSLFRDDGVLVVEVVDDGRGLPTPAVAGVGLGSMRERAIELGGTCEISSASGTKVHARIPILATVEEDDGHG